MASFELSSKQSDAKAIFFWYSAVHNSRSMTPITWLATVGDEEQRPLLQDILEAAVDDRRQAAATVASHLRSSHRWESCLGKIAEVASRCLPRGFYIRVSFSWIVLS